MLYVFLWLLCGMLAAGIYSNKGGSGLLGFLVGAIFGPIGVIIALVSKGDQSALERRELTNGTMKKCPSCAELVRSEATVCKHCGRELDATPLYPRVMTNGAGGFKCSDCGGAIRHDATSCKHCGVVFGQPKPLFKES